MTDKDDERLKNLILFKVYATDEEMGEIFPVVAIVVIVLIVGMLLYAKFF